MEWLLVLLIVGLVIAAIKLGRYPGQVAARRNHPNKDAIMILGQLGVLTFGILWIVALTWAYSNVATTDQFAGSGARNPERSPPGVWQTVATRLKIDVASAQRGECEGAAVSSESISLCSADTTASRRSIAADDMSTSDVHGSAAESVEGSSRTGTTVAGAT